MNKNGFTHLMSFIGDKCTSNLKMFLFYIQFFNFDNAVCYFYLSTEKVICVICNGEGHLAKHYTNSPQMQNFTVSHEKGVNPDLPTLPANDTPVLSTNK